MIPVSFGLRRFPKSMRLMVESQPGGRSALVAVPRPTAAPVQLFPAFRCRRKVHRRTIEVFLVTRDIDLVEAREVILRSHYLSIPSRGAYLACRFIGAREQLTARKAAFERLPKDAYTRSGDWHEPAGNVVACVVLDRLYHGNPTGREALAAKMHKSLAGTRSEIVERLGVAWISRIAVDAPYRDLGLGEALVRETMNLAKWLYPSPRCLEVITTEPADRKTPAQLRAKGRDFLCRAGFTRVEDSYHSSPQLVGGRFAGGRSSR